MGNALGSTPVLTDGSGNVTGTKTYEPFGTLRTTTGSASTEYQFTGQQQDATLGYTYLRARYYDPAIGRFISKDTHPAFSKLPQTINRYTYVDNDPTNRTDPKGEFGPFAGAAGLVILCGAVCEGVIAGILGGTTGLGIWAFAKANSNEDEHEEKQDKAENKEVSRPASPDLEHIKDHVKDRMEQRGWTTEQIREAYERGEKQAAKDYTAGGEPATRYVHPETGK